MIILVVCPACQGAGEIRSNPSPVADPQLETARTCATCQGRGEAEELDDETLE